MVKFFLGVIAGASPPLIVGLLLGVVGLCDFFRLPNHAGLKWAISGAYTIAIVWLNWVTGNLWAGALGWVAEVVLFWFGLPMFMEEIMESNNWILELLLVARLAISRGVGWL